MQSSISQDPPVARAGALANEGPRKVFSRTASTRAGAPAGINPGAACFRWSGTLPDMEREVRSPEDASAITTLTFIGVAMYDASKDQPYDASSGYLFPKGSELPVLREGQIWVNTEGAVKPGDAVHVRVVSATEEGSFLTAADSTNTVAVTGAGWVSVTSGAGLAILDLNLP